MVKEDLPIWRHLNKGLKEGKEAYGYLEEQCSGKRERRANAHKAGVLGQLELYITYMTPHNQSLASPQTPFYVHLSVIFSSLNMSFICSPLEFFCSRTTISPPLPMSLPLSGKLPRVLPYVSTFYYTFDRFPVTGLFLIYPIPLHFSSG